jgi:hypothetical protein
LLPLHAAKHHDGLFEFFHFQPLDVPVLRHTGSDLVLLVSSFSSSFSGLCVKLELPSSTFVVGTHYFFATTDLSRPFFELSEFPFFLFSASEPRIVVSPVDLSYVELSANGLSELSVFRLRISQRTSVSLDLELFLYHFHHLCESLK